MAKKKRVSVSRMQPRSYSEMYKDQKAESPTVAPRASTRRKAPVESQPVAPKGSESVNWQGEYGYVIKDLRWLIGISLVLFALLVVSGFLL